jgi:membrane peptidoglycan carboxypeptidase
MLGTTSTPLGTAYYAFQTYQHPMESKTGSAENQNVLAHAWFVGYAPPDQPKYLILVMVEGKGESMQVASPMARALMDYLWPNDATPVPPRAPTSPPTTNPPPRAPAANPPPAPAANPPPAPAANVAPHASAANTPTPAHPSATPAPSHTPPPPSAGAAIAHPSATKPPSSARAAIARPTATKSAGRH